MQCKSKEVPEKYSRGKWVKEILKKVICYSFLGLMEVTNPQIQEIQQKKFIPRHIVKFHNIKDRPEKFQEQPDRE